MLQSEINGKRIKMNQDKDVNKKKQILPRRILCLPPYRHHVMEIPYHKYKRQREIVKRTISGKKMVLKQTKQIPPRPKMCLNPHRHQVSDVRRKKHKMKREIIKRMISGKNLSEMCLKKHRRQREIVKRMIIRKKMVHLKFSLKQNQEKEVNKIKQIPPMTMMCLRPHRHQLSEMSVNTSGKAGAQIPQLPLGDDSSPCGR
jgi:hypothetical protein